MVTHVLLTNKKVAEEITNITEKILELHANIWSSPWGVLWDRRLKSTVLFPDSPTAS